MSAKEALTAEQLPRHRVSMTIVALGLPALFALAAVLLINSWRHELPDPVAQNWGTDGPNEFGSVDSQIIVLVIGILFFSLMFWGLAWFMPAARRALAGCSAGLAAMISALTVGTLSMQRGLADAAEATEIGGPLFLAMALGLGVGFGAAFLLPGDPPLPTAAPLPRGAAVAKLRPTDKRVWIGATGSRAIVILGVASTLVTAVMALALQLPGLLLLTVVLALAFVAGSYFHIRVDSNGLAARSAMGWPRLHVPLDEITSASTTTISPIDDFGGWGWRVGHKAGAVGIVTHKGEALEVQRTGGRAVFVTVADAKRGAELLNTLIQEQRGSE